MFRAGCRPSNGTWKAIRTASLSSQLLIPKAVSLKDCHQLLASSWRVAKVVSNTDQLNKYFCNTQSRQISMSIVDRQSLHDPRFMVLVHTVQKPLKQHRSGSYTMRASTPTRPGHPFHLDFTFLPSKSINKDSSGEPVFQPQFLRRGFQGL